MSAPTSRKRRRRRKCLVRNGILRTACPKPPDGRVRACSRTASWNDLAEILVGPIAPGEPDQRERRGKQSAVGEIVDRRHELLTGQIARNAENHHAARAGDRGIRLSRLSTSGLTPAGGDRRGHTGTGSFVTVISWLSPAEPGLRPEVPATTFRTCRHLRPRHDEDVRQIVPVRQVCRRPPVAAPGCR